MARIKYYADPKHRLRLPDGSYLYGGEEAEVSAAFAEQMLAWPAVDVDVYPGEEPIERPRVEQPPRVGYGSGRATWAEYAVAIGVPITNQMSRDQIIAAIDEATAPLNGDDTNEEED